MINQNTQISTEQLLLELLSRCDLKFERDNIGVMDRMMITARSPNGNQVSVEGDFLFDDRMIHNPLPSKMNMLLASLQMGIEQGMLCNSLRNDNEQI